ncbi:hypothetical protein PSN45_003576 [Yamadazyma tenuis]|uniref:FAR1 domain-containing protein n=1 Tax=Candida tenuis (strain ATCC 10573 / BCRC 21748 / CBS 615 / JCM 9827 / NBRC 10315 / NRRL Y-1498 / VKM Y-70) TaxID=590646 RepID=G3AXM0_CANTC|nr:uncharacterized protein CANTEDRAFT_112521 [Yamadazyma tenuis ATCC 10573]EGV65647.1 hypothetical protein CANTEDRAFT_112521 [Yamadazyma tenuis ATCC 10573]WEJ96042.1 hypothetical protein PSN45_003576 [Yamadazyma tenuis]
MSAEEDYSHNIDDQLLKAVKQEGVVLDQATAQELHHQSMHHHHQQQHHQQPHHLHHSHHQGLGPQGLPEGLGQPQGPGVHPHHQQHHPNFNDDSEFNIQIPDPILTSRSKIYPVQDNTITAEGNLITKPYPDQTFTDRKELNDFIAEFARDNGFGVVIAHSNKKAIYYTCELGGRYRDKKNKKVAAGAFQSDGYLMDPNTKTKKLRCPFAMTASFKKANQSWVLKVTCNEHNHPQLDPLSNHPMLRKRSTELNMLIVDLYKVGTKPSHIEGKIKEQYPDILIKREDIYNEIRGYKRKLKRENGYINNAGGVNGKRTNTNSFHQVRMEDDEDDFHHQHRNDVDLERLQQAAAAAVQQHQNQQQTNDIDSVAASMAAVANANNAHSNDQISMDNIDSRLVGE